MHAACEGGAIRDTVVPAKAGIRFAFVFARYVQQWQRQDRNGIRLSRQWRQCRRPVGEPPGLRLSIRCGAAIWAKSIGA